jgi:hypothetical protein
MLVLGLLLVAVGAIAIVAALGTAVGSVELLGTDMSAMALFFIGVGSGVAILWGFGLTKYGTRRSLRQRRESRRLSELSEKLDRHEAERREESSGHDDRSV